METIVKEFNDLKLAVKQRDEAMLKFKPETATYDVTEEYENEFG